MAALAFAPQVMKSTLNFLGGPALPTQYIVGIVPPSGMLKNNLLQRTIGNPILGYALSIPGAIALSILTEKVSIPGKGFQTADIIRHGKHMRMPVASLHDTIKITFICSNSMIERTFFDLWTQFIQGPSSHYMDYFDNYKTSIWIKKMKGSGLIDGKLADLGSTPTADNPLVEVGNTLSLYQLQEAYPIRIGAQELASGDTQGYLTLDVEFTYTHIKCALDLIVGDTINEPNKELLPMSPSVPT